MKSIPSALLWDFSNRGWWCLLNALAVGLGVPLIVYKLLLQIGPLELQAGRTLHFVLMFIGFVASAGAALAAHGDTERFYLLPLSNRTLAAVTLFPGMICVAGTYLITSGALNIAFGVRWPVWGPAVFLAVALGAIHAAALVAGTGWLKRFAAWCCVAMLLEAWLRARYGGGSFLMPRAMWASVNFGDLVWLSSMLAAVFFVTTYGIARDRRGDPAWLSMIDPIAGRLWGKIRAQKTMLIRPAFRNLHTAQFWFEWRQKGMILPALFAIFAAFLSASYLLGRFENGEYELLHSCFGFGTGLAPIALVTGLVMGHADVVRANPEWGTFLGSRPATNATLSGALLKTEAASLLVTWGAWSLAMLGTTWLLFRTQGIDPVLDLWTLHGKFASSASLLGYWYAVLLCGFVLAVAWTPLALASCLALTGRQRLLMTTVAVSVPVLLAGLYLAESRNQGHSLFANFPWQYFAGAAAALATAGGFGIAARRGLIGWPTCGIAAAGWLALCGVAVSVSLLLGSLEPASLVLMAGLLALPLAPWAAAPLALSWNRHR